MELDYEGDLTPKEVWTLLKEDEHSQLVDCRTSAEWSLVGVPELESINKSLIFIEWQTFPMMEKNPRFFQEISEKVSDKATKIIFLCRSGARSRSAAEFLTAQVLKNVIIVWRDLKVTIISLVKEEQSMDGSFQVYLETRIEYDK